MGLDFVKLEIGNLVSMGLVWGQILRFGFVLFQVHFVMNLAMLTKATLCNIS
jgi:hypothetical protein